MVRAAQQSAWQVAGLLSLPKYAGSEKISIWAQDLHCEEKRLLASVQRKDENDLVFGKWFFNRQTLVWGKDVLKASIPCDLLVVDELGPIELRLSQGWTNALDVILTGQFHLALVVIRPELVELVQPFLNFNQVISFSKVDEVAEKVLHYSSWFNGIRNSLT